MCPGGEEPSFGLVILHRYTNSQPAPRSRLFSRPDDPRSSALIGLWNVEKALPAPRHSCLHYNLFVFQFSLQYWKVEKKLLILQADHPEKRRTDTSLVSDRGQIVSEALLMKTNWIELQMHEVKCEAVLLSPQRVDIDDNNLHATPSVYLSQQSRFGSDNLKCTRPYPSSVIFTVLKSITRATTTV